MERRMAEAIIYMAFLRAKGKTPDQAAKNAAKHLEKSGEEFRTRFVGSETTYLWKTVKRWPERKDLLRRMAGLLPALEVLLSTINVDSFFEMLAQMLEGPLDDF